MSTVPDNERRALFAFAALLKDVCAAMGGHLTAEFFEQLQWGVADGTYDESILLAQTDADHYLSGVDGIAGLYRVLQSLPQETRDAIRGNNGPPTN